MWQVKNILSVEGLGELRSFVTSERCLIALDFDGTLAPIVDSPERAAMRPDVEVELQRVAKVCEILILTGRRVDDVQNRLPKEVKFILGNHGLEGSSRVTPEMLHVAKETTRNWSRHLGERFAKENQFMVEDKEYSLAIHFRQAFIEKWARFRAHREARMLKPAALILDGKCVVNVIPPGLPDKYIAISSLMEDMSFKRAIFVGDDVTDNQVFRAKDPRILSVKIGQERSLIAPWHLQKQESIVDFLRAIVAMQKK